MTTAVYSLAEGVGGRLKEASDIADRAQLAFDEDQVLYDILCRSGCVLLVSALEAFIKDLNVAIQSDLNYYLSEFSDMPKKMQREFSEKIVFFEGVPEGDLKKRASQLIKFFQNNSVKIDMSAFPYKESGNKNPSGNMIDTAFNKFGITSILFCLAGSKFEAVFDNDSSTDALLRRDITRMRATTYKFPYRKLPANFSMLDWVSAKSQIPPGSLWTTFLENLLGRRHGVVHADVRSNPTSWQVIRDDVNKLEILFSGLLFAASSLIGEDI